MQIVYPPSELRSWLSTIYGPAARLLLTDYSYVIDLGTVAANGRVTRQLQIPANADFVLLGLDYSMAAFTGGDTSSLIYIVDSATGEAFSNTRTRLFNVANAGPIAITKNLPYPRWIRGNTALTVELTQGPSGGVTDFQLDFHGFLVRELA